MCITDRSIALAKIGLLAFYTFGSCSYVLMFVKMVRNSGKLSVWSLIQSVIRCINKIAA